jgi:AcrR family transcriptional regulator
MSPQHSNRAELIAGTLRCLERLPPERITARVISEESGANLASIAYHFGSKDNLVTVAAIEGLDRWLADIIISLDDVAARTPAAKFRRAAEVFDSSRQRHLGLIRNFIGALAKAQHDDRIRDLLAAGYRRTRPVVAALLDLGSDQDGDDAGGLVLALFHGLMLQATLDPALAVEGTRMQRAQARLRRILPDSAD